jgi:hypothetical protein
MLAPTNLVALEDIVVDPRTYLRASQHSDVVSSFADAMEEHGAAGFPPIILHREGSSLYLSDGHLRVRAAKQAGVRALPATVRPGSLREAILFACGANSAHGVRRTNADKRLAIRTLLNDGEWSRLSNNRIAEATGTSSIMVGKLRGAVATVQVIRAGVSYAMKPRAAKPKARPRAYLEGRADQLAEDVALAEELGCDELVRRLRGEPAKVLHPQRFAKQKARAEEAARLLGPRVDAARRSKKSWANIARELNREGVPSNAGYAKMGWSETGVRGLHERYLRNGGTAKPQAPPPLCAAEAGIVRRKA